ncbi:hypothetical protein ASD15_18565 [Massilia sp. Root351]|nr:hypothetical protein ASD15_18565 [Massilia sp. Root351]
MSKPGGGDQRLGRDGVVRQVVAVDLRFIAAVARADIQHAVHVQQRIEAGFGLRVAAVELAPVAVVVIEVEHAATALGGGDAQIAIGIGQPVVCAAWRPDREPAGIAAVEPYQRRFIVAIMFDGVKGFPFSEREATAGELGRIIVIDRIAVGERSLGYQDLGQGNALLAIAVDRVCARPAGVAFMVDGDQGEDQAFVAEPGEHVDVGIAEVGDRLRFARGHVEHRQHRAPMRRQHAQRDKAAVGRQGGAGGGRFLEEGGERNRRRGPGLGGGDVQRHCNASGHCQGAKDSIHAKSCNMKTSP